jgi:hypothetical protein
MGIRPVFQRYRGDFQEVLQKTLGLVGFMMASFVDEVLQVVSGPFELLFHG